jgi:hypothetical protein
MADLPKAVEEEKGSGAPRNAGFPSALGFPKADAVVEEAGFPSALGFPKSETWAGGVPKTVEGKSGPDELGNPVFPNALGCFKTGGVVEEANFPNAFGSPKKETWAEGGFVRLPKAFGFWHADNCTDDVRFPNRLGSPRATAVVDGFPSKLGFPNADA